LFLSGDIVGPCACVYVIEKYFEVDGVIAEDFEYRSSCGAVFDFYGWWECDGTVEAVLYRC
jgi:hypothetical protein